MSRKTRERTAADDELRIAIGKAKDHRDHRILYGNQPFISRMGGTKYMLPLGEPFIPPADKSFKTYEEWGARMLDHFAKAGKPAGSIRIDDAFCVPLIIRAKTDPAPTF